MAASANKAHSSLYCDKLKTSDIITMLNEIKFLSIEVL